jgi:hypothetical protein
MTRDEQIYLMVCGEISRLPIEQQQLIKNAEVAIRRIVLDAGAEGYMALAKLGAELAHREKLDL